MTNFHKKISIFIFLLAPLLMSARYNGPAYCVNASKARDKFATQFAKKHDLEFLFGALGDMADADRANWGLSLVSRKLMTIEEARKLSTELSYQFLYLMYHDPVFVEYCKTVAAEYAGHPKWAGHDNTCPDLKNEYIAFRLAFWDKDNNRPLYPYVAQVRLADGKLYYHYADPVTQALQDPIVESLESLNLPPYKPEKS